MPRTFIRHAFLAGLVALALGTILIGSGSATAQKNACVNAHGQTRCTWDITVDASANQTLVDDAPGASIKMESAWTATYKGVDLAIQGRLDPSGDLKDVYKPQGGRAGSGVISGRFS